MKLSTYFVIALAIVTFGFSFAYSVWGDYKCYLSSFKSRITSVIYHNRGGYEYFYDGGSFFGDRFSSGRNQFLKIGDLVEKDANSTTLKVILQGKTVIYKSEESYFFTKLIAN